MKKDRKVAIQEFIAWYTSGNSVPVDIRHEVKVNGDRIMADAERVKGELVEEDERA